MPLAGPGCFRHRLQLTHAAFLRRYDLDRLPQDATLWVSAAESLLDAPDALVGIGSQQTTTREEALKAAEKACELDPKMTAAKEVLKRARGTP